MHRVIRFGSRESALAITQTQLIMTAVAAAHPELSPILVTMKTRGDLHPEIPFGTENTKGLFTDALERALAAGEIDLCVHSLKDLPVIDNENLPLVGMATRGDPRDMLVLPRTLGAEKFCAFAAATGKKLNANLPIGCGSRRRNVQLLALADRLAPRFFPAAESLKIAPIRGNVPTRLAKLDAEQYSAVILAAAGLQRLGIADRAGYYFAVEEMTPAAGQGVLAIQGRRGEDFSFLDCVRDPHTEMVAQAERRLVRELGGGCALPSGAFAQIIGEEAKIIAMSFSAGKIFRETIVGARRDIFALAEKLARRLTRAGDVS